MGISCSSGAGGKLAEYFIPVKPTMTFRDQDQANGLLGGTNNSGVIIGISEKQIASSVNDAKRQHSLRPRFSSLLQSIASKYSSAQLRA